MSAARVNLPRLQTISFVIGGLLLLAGLLGAAFNPIQFFRAYLLAFLFWVGVPLGCLALLMIYHLVGGAWGIVIRNALESAARTLPLFVVAPIPLFFGIKFLYPWANGALLDANEKMSSAKLLYFKAPFFIGRTLFYFAVWYGIAWIMKRRAGEHPENSEAAPSDGLRVASAWGLVLYCLVASFAAIDWLMSLEPSWYSTVFGMLFIVGQALTALTTVILLLSLVGERERLARIPGKPLLDLGNLLLTFVMLWTYLAFMQFLIVWAGNLKEEIPWYVRRNQGGWTIISWALFLFHFLVPFVLLLSRASKSRIRILAVTAALIWLARFVDYFWHLGPLQKQANLPLHWLYLVVPIGLGAIWLGFWVRQIRRQTTVLSIPHEEVIVS